MPKIDRRNFLKVTLSATGGLLSQPLLLGCGNSADPGAHFDPKDIPEADLSVFPLGIQSSEPLPDSVILWLHYTGEASSLTLQIFKLESVESDPIGGGPPILSLDVSPSPYLQLEVEDLDPDQTYGYTFIFDDEDTQRSPVGRFRTAPEATDLVPLRFSASACTHRSYAPFGCLSHAAKTRGDLHLLLGDTTYADGAKSREEYRTHWADSYSSLGYRELRSNTSILATWDDHEVSNNWIAVPEDDPEQPEGMNRSTRVGPRWLSAATDVFFEHVAARSPQPGRIWRSLRWGKTAEFFVLDCRGERSAEEGTYVGREQMDWLKASLTASDAHWKFIVNSVPIFEPPPGLDEIMAPDQWLGVPAQRSEILDHIEGKIEGVVWLSGDIHLAAVARVSRAADQYPGQTDIVVGHAGSFPNPNPVAEFMLDVDKTDQFTNASGEQGTMMFELDPTTDPDTLRYSYVGHEGDVYFEGTLTR